MRLSPSPPPAVSAASPPPPSSSPRHRHPHQHLVTTLSTSSSRPTPPSQPHATHHRDHHPRVRLCPGKNTTRVLWFCYTRHGVRLVRSQHHGVRFGFGTAEKGRLVHHKTNKGAFGFAVNRIGRGKEWVCLAVGTAGGRVSGLG
ncbi:hypothetical protein Tco_1118527 [Tanacetum coccineum]